MVERRVALLHGAVRWPHQAAALASAAGSVPGIVAVRSRLRVGLLPGDSVPSQGRRCATAAPSPAMSALVEAVRRAGAADSNSTVLASAALTALLERVPAAERRHVLQHLPHDVRSMVGAVAHGGTQSEARTIEALVTDAARQAGDASSEMTAAVVGAVATTLAGLVPEELDDVLATMPPALRAVWSGGGRDVLL
jgi:uncharacterized protein (DUF2267 family)